MEYAKIAWKDGKQLRRFARFSDLGAYYAESDTLSPNETAWYRGTGGQGWVNMGLRATVEERIRTGQLRGKLDTDAITSDRIGGADVIHVGGGVAHEAGCFKGLL